jgi:hypothetical protein
MKKVIYLFVIIALYSCNSYSKLMKEYDESYNVKLYSPITNEILYTNSVIFDNGFVCFTDHLNRKQCLSNASILFMN